MIPTLATGLFLYRVNRNRDAMLIAIEKRRAFWLICGIVACLTAAVYILIITFG